MQSSSVASMTTAGIRSSLSATNASRRPWPHTSTSSAASSPALARVTVMGCLRPTFEMLSTISRKTLRSRSRGFGTVMRSTGIN